MTALQQTLRLLPPPGKTLFASIIPVPASAVFTGLLSGNDIAISMGGNGSIYPTPITVRQPGHRSSTLQTAER
jgi:hypothetical protein